MNTYRFLSTKPGEQQVDGFFVDDQDRVLYWPTDNGPGYVLTVEEALRIAQPDLEDTEFDRFFGGALKWIGYVVMAILFFSMFSVVRPLHEATLQIVTEYFSGEAPELVQFALFTAFAIAQGASVILVVNLLLRILRAIVLRFIDPPIDPLASVPRTSLQRPEPIQIHPFKYGLSTAAARRAELREAGPIILIVTLAIGGCLWVIFSDFGKNAEIVGGVLAIGTIATFSGLVLSALKAKGIRVSDAETLAPELYEAAIDAFVDRSTNERS